MDRQRYRQFAAGLYLEYQKRYVERIRESDRVIVDMVETLIADRRRKVSLLDVGCSTGNLLLHLRGRFPDVELFGGDLYPEIIETCRRNPQLRNIQFEVMDVLDLRLGRNFDLVVVNAVLYLFSQDDFDRAVASIARVIVPGGHFIAFDLFHNIEQHIDIIERSVAFPKGHALHFRPFSETRATLERHGFDNVQFVPFRIPIDLPKPDSQEDVSSYTVRTEQSERLIFRGGLFTPWCHLRARKAAQRSARGEDPLRPRVQRSFGLPRDHERSYP